MHCMRKQLVGLDQTHMAQVLRENSRYLNKLQIFVATLLPQQSASSPLLSVIVSPAAIIKPLSWSFLHMRGLLWASQYLQDLIYCLQGLHWRPQWPHSLCLVSAVGLSINKGCLCAFMCLVILLLPPLWDYMDYKCFSDRNSSYHRFDCVLHTSIFELLISIFCDNNLPQVSEMHFISY